LIAGPQAALISFTGQAGIPGETFDGLAKRSSGCADRLPKSPAAVEHGIEAGRTPAADPLLIIAGAGSGKTNTLAHRVAHLIVNRVARATFQLDGPPPISLNAS
jgi:hypothetical protein